MKTGDQSVKVLHIASFHGNVGDSAMHDGAYRTRREDCPLAFDYTPLEVREFFHWGQRKFDADFVDYLNGFDLAIVGGLGAYQLWRADTASGTCFDLAPDMLQRIEKPVIFYGLGCDASRGVDALAMDKFRRFLDVGYEKNFMFSLRNDGSQPILQEAVGAPHISPMPVIPDGGLFARPSITPNEFAYHGEKIVAINLAGCMPDKRFAAAAAGSPTLNEFAQGIALLGCDLLEAQQGVRLVFVPHIYSDLELISNVLNRLPDEYRRRHVSVAPYLNGGSNWSCIFDIYRQASLVIGMRFHACVVAIGMGTPVIGINTHHKIEGLFNDMQLSSDCIALSDEAWLERLRLKSLDFIRSGEVMRPVYAEKVDNKRKELGAFHGDMLSWYLNWQV